ncbi:MAG: NAD(P)H-hydrate dehydratase [Clostridia bacterium]|nr:NAD(P)H-hydrate dehydratase [Clostridia bacterium]
MEQLLTATQMRAADEATIQSGISSRELMERAARAALSVLEESFDTLLVLFLCGSGNNGGDGLAMARFFAEKGGKARVIYLGKLTAAGSPDTDCMSEECRRQFSLLPSFVEVCTDLKTDGATAAVDAIFGIGLARPIEGRAAEAINALRATAVPVLALDIPSGIHADTGTVLGTALPAKQTVAISAKKWGHMLYPGASFCGEITVAEIGICAENCSGYIVQKSDILTLPPRPARAHKGTFGRVLVIGGSVGMSGAGFLAAKAAMRAGAGLVEIFAPTENRIIYQTQLPEALLTLYDPDQFDESLLLSALSRTDAVAIGMGLSQSETARRMVTCALANARVPLIVDADGLNLMAGDPYLLALCYGRTDPTILTPHLGEMSRLSGHAIAELTANLPYYALSFAKSSGTVLVMKDARTVISNGEKLFLNPYGNSGMATGGSGDVLAGVIASFTAQGAAPIDAARLGVLAHALAGDAAADTYGNRGMIAGDIIEMLCKVLT